jgi:hypothetical protein
MSSSATSRTADAASFLRLVLLGIFLLGIGGLSAELLLIEHFEDLWQVTPFVLFAVSAVVLLWHAAARRAASVLAFRYVMVLFIAAGFLGVYLHYTGNVEFEREMSPALIGWGLFREAVTGATPALAPGAMIQLGLIGLAFTLRHPALRRERSERLSGRPTQ